MKTEQICKDGSIFLFIGITSAAFALAPVYFLGKRLVVPQSIPLNTPERVILYAALAWLAGSLLLSCFKRISYLMPDDTIAIKFVLCGIPLKTLDLGRANACTISISQDTVSFKRETKNCVNIVAFSPKDYKSHVLGSYLSVHEAESELEELTSTIRGLNRKRQA